MTRQLCYIICSSIMSVLKNHWRIREVHGLWLLLAAHCFIGAACSTSPQSAKVVFEDPRATVILQQISDRSFTATQPVSLDPALIARVLSGVLVQERQRALQAIVAGSSPPTPVFSAEEIQFLAPLLANALAAAASDQVVGFVLKSQRPGASSLEYSSTEATAGSLYVYGASLGFSLSQYRYASTRTGSENIARRRLPDSSGLADRALLFSPTHVQRSDNVLRPPTGVADDKFLAINYRLLQQVPQSTSQPEQTAARPDGTAELVRQDAAAIPPSGVQSNRTSTLEQRDQEIQTLKDLVIKKDLELEAIRKELQSLRKQLDDRTTRQDSQRRNNRPPSKLQDPAP
jgi:hypothetical protein